MLNSVKPIKIIRTRFFNEPRILFGYNKEKNKYTYICYNNSSFSINYIINPIIFEKLDDNDNDDNKMIENEEIIILFYQFLIIRQEDRTFMKRLFKYLCKNILPKINNIKFNDEYYKKLAERINEMVEEQLINTPV